jgi:hypothetical protein
MDPSFIKEYQLSDLTICDALIELFHKGQDKGLAKPGVVGSDQEIDNSTKKSTDFWLVNAGAVGTPDQFKWPEYHTELSGFIDNYCNDAKIYEYGGRFEMKQLPQIQWYKPGEGFYKWHIDGAHEQCDRVLVFMTYLNTVQDGGTEFMHQNVITQAVKGKTVIFPAGLTHLHRGRISQTEDKYIITGWIWWDNQR